MKQISVDNFGLTDRFKLEKNSLSLTKRVVLGPTLVERNTKR